MRVLKLLLSASKDQVTTTLGITKVIKLIFGKVTGCLNRKDARLHLSAHIVGPVAEKLTVVWFSKSSKWITLKSEWGLWGLSPVGLIGEPREAVHERVLRGGDLGLVTLLGWDPIDLGGRGVGVQEAVHYGDAPGVHCDLIVLNCLVVTHRSVFELMLVNLKSNRHAAVATDKPWIYITVMWAHQVTNQNVD